MQQKDRELLTVIQSDFPIVQRPFKVIADRIGWTEHEVIDTINALKENGTIRAFGPVFDARKLGYSTTLIAARVENDRIDALAGAMRDINEITHSYLRDHDVNVWFTISALNREIMDTISGWVNRFPGVSRILNLPAVKVYKINAVFGASETAQLVQKYNVEIHYLNEMEKSNVILLQDVFPIVGEPFKFIAKQKKADESLIIDTINSWLGNGIIRRFGARINHRRAGYTENTMAVWEYDTIDYMGQKFASLPCVSHCYRRPYELYTMVHARSENEINQFLFHMNELAPGAGSIFLRTVRELKKTSMKYFMENRQWDTPSQD